MEFRILDSRVTERSAEELEMEATPNPVPAPMDSLDPVAVQMADR